MHLLKWRYSLHNTPSNDGILGILNEETHSSERDTKEKVLFLKQIRFWTSLNFNHTKNKI